MNDEIPHDRDDEGAELWARYRAFETPGGACPDPVELASWLDGEAEREAAERIEEHLSRCPDCLATLVDHRRPSRGAVEPIAMAAVARARRLAPSPSFLRRERAHPHRLLVAASWLGLLVSVAAAGVGGYLAGTRMLDAERTACLAFDSGDPLDLGALDRFPEASLFPGGPR